MDIERALQAFAGTRSPVLTENDHRGLTAYFTALLQQHAAGEVKEQEALESVMFLIAAIDNRDLVSVRNSLNQNNWPSKTGNPSGGGRSNAPGRAR